MLELHDRTNNLDVIPSMMVIAVKMPHCKPKYTSDE